MHIFFLKNEIEREEKKILLHKQTKSKKKEELSNKKENKIHCHGNWRKVALKENKLTRMNNFKEKWENFYDAIKFIAKNKWKWEKIKGKLKMEAKRKFFDVEE